MPLCGAVGAKLGRDYADCKFHAVAIAVNYKNGSTMDNSIVDRNCIDILIGCSIITLHY